MGRACVTMVLRGLETMRWEGWLLTGMLLPWELAMNKMHCNSPAWVSSVKHPWFPSHDEKHQRTECHDCDNCLQTNLICGHVVLRSFCTRPCPTAWFPWGQGQCLTCLVQPCLSACKQALKWSWLGAWNLISWNSALWFLSCISNWSCPEPNTSPELGT